MKDISEDVKEMIQVELGYSPNEQLKAQLVDQSIAVDPSKRLINIIKIKAKGEYRHLHFITCYQNKEKVKKLLS